MSLHITLTPLDILMLQQMHITPEPDWKKKAILKFESERDARVAVESLQVLSRRIELIDRERRLAVRQAQCWRRCFAVAAGWLLALIVADVFTAYLWIRQ